MTAVRSLLFVALFYLWSVIVAVRLHAAPAGPPRAWTCSRCSALLGPGRHRLLPDLRHPGRGARPRAHPDRRGPGRPQAPVHAGRLRPVHLAAAPAAFVMKKELAWIPLFGWYAKQGGRRSSSTARRHSTAHAQADPRRDRRCRKTAARLVIFPEGTRTTPGAAADYKPGIAALYRELDVPVYPVATNAGVHWPPHGLMRKPGPIVFEYLEPIPPGLKRAEFMRLLEERIERSRTKLLTLYPVAPWRHHRSTMPSSFSMPCRGPASPRRCSTRSRR